MPVLNVLEGVVQYEFGETITLTMVDNSGVAVDISSYTGTDEVTFRHKDGQTVVTRTLSLVGGGTTGQVSFSFAAGNIIKSGEWRGQVKLRNGAETIITYSKTFVMNVAPNIWVST